MHGRGWGKIVGMFRRRSSEAGKNQAAVADRHHAAAPAGHSADHGASHRPGHEASDPAREQDEPWGRPPAWP